MKNNTAKQQLCALLHISEETYAMQVERFGYAFAWHYTLHHKWSVEYLTKTAAYWHWFKNHQQTRDEMFIAEMCDYKGIANQAELIDLWLDHNSPQEIECRPTKQVLDEAYQLMLEAVNEERNGQLQTTMETV